MKYPVLFRMPLMIAISFSFQSLSAQDTTRKPHWVSMTIKATDQSKTRRFLYKLNDDSLYVIGQKLRQISHDSLQSLSRTYFSSLSPEHIYKINFHPSKNAPLIGALIGFGAGTIAGLLSGNDPPGWVSFTAAQKALMLGTTGLVTGALVGFVIHWAASKSFLINGSRERYRTEQIRMRKFSLLQ